MHIPLQVGITGGIGAGKSLVTSIFRKLGIPVYDADVHARELMSSDPILIDLIKKEFGEKAYAPDQTLDRKYLSGQTFGKPEKLEKLNSLVHPRVKLDYSGWLTKNDNAPYVLREAALLYESNSYLTLDKMITVSAPEIIRIRRVLARDPQRGEDQIKAIINSQLSEDEKLKRADYTIINDDKSMVIPQVLKLHTLLLKESVR